MNTILYIQCGSWYIWVLRPFPNDWMIFGAWAAYGRKY